MIAANKF